MELQERVIELEKTVDKLSREIKEIKKFINKENNQDREWQRNVVDKYMIKVVYPGIYTYKREPVAGFPKNRKKLVEDIHPGQYMFIYVTSPVKKVIGLVEVTSEMKEIGDGKWPYLVDLKWVIGPKQGVTFKDLDLNIRPRIGDTLYSLSEDKALEVKAILEKQQTIDDKTLEYLAKEYEEK